MRWRQSWIVASLALVACGEARPTGFAEILTPDGRQVGIAVMTLEPDGVRVDAEFQNLPPGVHGIHVHVVGKCGAPDFTSAGPHYNPFGKAHGRQNPLGKHVGDMPNLVIEPDGTARYTAVLGAVTLVGDGNLSLLRRDGTAVVVHEDPDDETTDPAGNAGKRIACGVIRRQ